MSKTRTQSSLIGIPFLMKVILLKFLTKSGSVSDKAKAGRRVRIRSLNGSVSGFPENLPF